MGGGACTTSKKDSRGQSNELLVLVDTLGLAVEASVARNEGQECVRPGCSRALAAYGTAMACTP